MFEEYNSRLTDAKVKIREKQRLEASRDALARKLKAEEARLIELKEILTKEKIDVDKLEGLSIAGLFHTILGKKEQQLEKERQEYLAAKLKHDECCSTIEALKSEFYALQGRLNDIGDIEKDYTSILKQKESILLESTYPDRLRLMELMDKGADASSRIKEIREAIFAGEKVRQALQKALSALNSASNWGVYDMLGGGFIATAVKHSRIDEAKAEIHEVQYLLDRFRRELGDVYSNQPSLSIDIGSFATFADYFFDGLIADWVVQSRIKESQESTQRLLESVNRILYALKNDMNSSQAELQSTEGEKAALLEGMQ